MRSMMASVTRLMVVGVLGVGFGSVALAQPCQPVWDGTLGAVGTTGGYVAPMTAYGPSGAESLYAGGSFSNIGGSGAAYLGRYDPATNRWSRVGTGIGQGFTNAFLTSLVTYPVGGVNELIVGGFYANAGGLAGTRSLAKWNGTAWSSLNTNWTTADNYSVWAMLNWDGIGGRRLYVGGRFAAVGGIATDSIAWYDGESWNAMNTLLTSVSGNPGVFALAAFDDGTGPALYAGGRFNTINGVNAAFVAKWDGEVWSRVGTGITGGSTFSGIEAMAVFDDGTGPALYVGGWDLTPPGSTVRSVVKWNGTSWSPAGQYLGGRTTALKVWDDGSGPKLYAGGTAQPGISYVAVLENGQWTPLAGGVTGAISGNFPSVFGLAVWQDALLVGGDFTTAGTGAGAVSSRGIVVRTGCPSRCAADVDNGSGTGVPDGATTIEDLLYYLGEYDAGASGADIDNGTLTGTPDGGVTIEDLLYYLTRYDAGC